MMAAMGMPMNAPWTARDLLFTFAMWAVMMIGMMTPTATPVLLLLAGAQARRAQPGSALVVPSFALGYLSVWVGFSGLAAMAQWGLHEAAPASGPLGGAILIAAGVYQLTPLKAACLTRCQTPLGFLLSHWRDGASGAYRMGVRHGVFCLGCCWALMLVLFVVGVMNLAWVGVLTLFILAEKLVAAGHWIARAGGAVLITLGVVVVSR